MAEITVKQNNKQQNTDNYERKKKRKEESPSSCDAVFLWLPNYWRVLAVGGAMQHWVAIEL